MSRATLALAALIGMSSACSFLPCSPGCVGEFTTTDVSETVDVTCRCSHQLITPNLPFEDSCHANVYTKSKTPSVCELVAPTPDGFGLVGTTPDVKCLAAGKCTIYKHMERLGSNCVCPPEPKADCKTTCGATVPHGWSGKDDGSNACNNCNCIDGGLACTLMACPDAPKCPEKAACKTTCGATVPHGWSGKDDGSNACNNCNCIDGGLACTLMACPDAPKCPEKAACKTTCGVTVPHGWSGKDDGSNACNNCNCIDGGLACTKMGCEGFLTTPCPGQAACKTTCGATVPHGWSGKDDGSNACNDCRCNDGGLACTLMACPDAASCL